MINDDRCETDDSEHDKVKSHVDIEFGTSVVYECKGEVTLFRGIPCSAEVTSMKRFFLDDDGGDDGGTELELEEYPHYITLAAEKKMVEEI